MRYEARVKAQIVARLQIDAEYPGAAEQAAEDAVRRAVETHLTHAGVAIDSIEVRGDYDDEA